MLEVSAVRKTFSLKQDKKKGEGNIDPREEGDSFHALRKVDFSVPKGTILGLLGANGAGKTTLMRILATSLKPTSGTVKLLGFDSVNDANEVRRRIGFLSGNTGLYNHLNSEELLNFFGRLYGIPKDELKFKIETLFEELEIKEFSHRPIGTLSAGMKQRISIARSLVHSPEFIIFDEPTTGLDVPTAQIVLSYIEKCKSSSKSVIFSTHHMHEVEKLCDQVVLIHKGLLRFSGTVAQMKLQTNCNHLDDAYLNITGEDMSKKAHYIDAGQRTPSFAGGGI
ncbi:ABC transporter ATP-binding protein [Undibacterium sp. TJN19]|uniref:ABC transporter ATP-binding protein n=1 Tax=Undibacterium sp. TJN19 TaxID=3413055 RepID=UPI003BF435F8